MVKHPAANLTLRLLEDSCMETLVAVRGALKELYVLTNICDVWLQSIIHLVNCVFMKIYEL